MDHRRNLVSVIAAVAFVVSCGGEVRTDDALPPATDAAQTVQPVTANPPPAVQAVELDQPAIWPAPDVVFVGPEAAAENYVSEVLGVVPLLGEFMQGDSRSGEIEVFSPSDGDGAQLFERGVLALRMIGPNDGWFVIAANSAGVTIESPDALDRVPASGLVVTGQGRGFEGTVVVTAFRAGDAGDVFDQVITRGGLFESLEPFAVTLDLSGGEPGDVVAVMVRGDTGLTGDPGEFASIPIVISNVLPATR